MKTMLIKKKSIRKIDILKEFDLNRIQIGVIVNNDEDKLVGLKNNGDCVLPSVSFGSKCKKNAYGYTYSDKSKPKVNRYITTNWVHPFGNVDADMIPVDIYRNCYPKVYVPSTNIEIQLYVNSIGEKFVLANLTDEIKEKYLKEVINIFLEIYGCCYVFEEKIEIDNSLVRNRCNWEILPPGEMPSKHLKRQLTNTGKSVETYEVHRLSTIESYDPKEIVEGLNGFMGYYAYIFNDMCVLESAVYGNATYIIPVDNWEELSQKTKGELIDEKKVIAKIDHNKKWSQNLFELFNEKEIL